MPDPQPFVPIEVAFTDGIKTVVEKTDQGRFVVKQYDTRTEKAAEVSPPNGYARVEEAHGFALEFTDQE